MPKINKTPRVIACAETDVDYPFKDLAVNAVKALITIAEDDSAPTSEAARKAIEAIDALATVVNKAYINANETAQDLDVQNPPDLGIFLNILCCAQQQMERDLQTHHHSKAAGEVRSITMANDNERLAKFFKKGGE